MWDVDAAVFELRSFHGPPLRGNAQVCLLSEEAFRFVAPAELAEVGMLWGAHLERSEQLKGVVKEAHARAARRLQTECERLAKLGLRPSIDLGSAKAKGAGTHVGTDYAVIVLSGDALHLHSVADHLITGELASLELNLDDADAVSLAEKVALKIAELEGTGALPQRGGELETPTLRGELSSLGHTAETGELSAAPLSALQTERFDLSELSQEEQDELRSLLDEDLEMLEDAPEASSGAPDFLEDQPTLAIQTDSPLQRVIPTARLSSAAAATDVLDDASFDKEVPTVATRALGWKPSRSSEAPEGGRHASPDLPSAAGGAASPGEGTPTPPTMAPRDVEQAGDMATPAPQFSDLADLVGEGIASGQTGEIQLDASAFAQLATTDLAQADALDQEAAALEAQARELRSKADMLRRRHPAVTMTDSTKPLAPLGDAPVPHARGHEVATPRADRESSRALSQTAPPSPEETTPERRGGGRVEVDEGGPQGTRRPAEEASDWHDVPTRQFLAEPEEIELSGFEPHETTATAHDVSPMRRAGVIPPAPASKDAGAEPSHRPDTWTGFDGLADLEAAGDLDDLDDSDDLAVLDDLPEVGELAGADEPPGSSERVTGGPPRSTTRDVVPGSVGGEAATMVFSEGVALQAVQAALAEGYEDDEGATQLAQIDVAKLRREASDSDVFGSAGGEEAWADERDEQDPMARPPSREREAPVVEELLGDKEEAPTRTGAPIPQPPAAPTPEAQGVAVDPERVGLVVEDERAKARLAVMLSASYPKLVPCSSLADASAAHAEEPFAAVVLVRPTFSGETLDGIARLGSTEPKPEITVLSNEPIFDATAGVDRREDLARRASDVAEQVANAFARGR